MHSYPRHWRISASWGTNWGPLETPPTERNYYIEGLRGPQLRAPWIPSNRTELLYRRLKGPPIEAPLSWESWASRCEFFQSEQRNGILSIFKITRNMIELIVILPFLFEPTEILSGYGVWQNRNYSILATLFSVELLSPPLIVRAW